MGRLTTVSKVFIALTVFTVLVALVFKGHLLVYAAILLLTALVVIYLWSLTCVRGLWVAREHAPTTLKGKTITVTLRLINSSRSPRFLVFGYDHFTGEAKGKEYKAVVFRSVRGRGEATILYEATARRRGAFSIGPFYLYTGDPLGFFKHAKKVGVFTELLVLPLPLSTRINYLRSRSTIAKDEYSTISLPGASTEFLGVREYQAGDAYRKIHWLSSAKVGELITKQFERNVASTLSVVLVNNASCSVGRLEEHTPLEYSVTMIATLANEICRLHDYFSFLELNDSGAFPVSGMGGAVFEKISHALARTTVSEDFSLSQYYTEVYRSLTPGSDLIIFIPQVLEEDARFLENVRSHYRTLTVVTFDLQSFRMGLPRRSDKPRFGFGRNFLTFEIAFGDDLALRLKQLIEKAGLIK